MFGGIFYGYNIGNGSSLLVPLRNYFFTNSNEEHHANATLSFAPSSDLFNLFSNLFSNSSSSSTITNSSTSFFISLIPSSLLLGAALGSFLNALFVRRFGFRTCMLFLSLLSGFLALASSLCPFFLLLVALRFFMGICTGISNALCPMYVAETSPPQYRGALGAIWKLGATSGTMMGFSTGFLVNHWKQFFFNFFNFNENFTLVTVIVDRFQWQWIMGLCLVYSICMFIVFLVMPESPVWTKEHGKVPLQHVVEQVQATVDKELQDQEGNNESNTATSPNESTTTSEITIPSFNEVTLNNADANGEEHLNLTEEFNKEQLQQDALQPNTSNTDHNNTSVPKPSTPSTQTIPPSLLSNLKLLITDAENRKLMVLGTLLAVNFRLTGIWAFLLFTPSIFKDAGFTGLMGDTAATIGVGIFNVVTTLSSIALVDCWGRKPLLTLGNISTIITTFAYGLNVMFVKTQPLQGILSIVCIGVFFIGFNAGIGSLVLLLFNELFKHKPQSLKALAVSLLTALTWILSFISGIMFLPLIDLIGQAALFWLFSGTCVLVTIALAIFMPETKHVATPVVQK